MLSLRPRTFASPEVGAEHEADLLLVNGRVYTVAAGGAWAESVAIRDEWILRVGTNAEMRELAGPDTRIIDLGGAFVSPGFNDAHVHMDGTGELLTGVNLLDVHDRDGFRERIAATARNLPEGSWITRGMWGAYEQWPRAPPARLPAPRSAGGPSHRTGR